MLYVLFGERDPCFDSDYYMFLAVRFQRRVQLVTKTAGSLYLY